MLLAASDAYAALVVLQAMDTDIRVHPPPADAGGPSRAAPGSSMTALV